MSSLPLSAPGKTQLPHVEPLGRVKVNFVKVYGVFANYRDSLILKASAKNDGDNPELFIDLEHPRPEFEQQDGAELHLGISANFRLEQRRDSSVKPHLDIYVPESEIPKLLQALIQANLRRPRP